MLSFVRKSRIVQLVVICGFLVGCNAGPNQTNIELIQDMMDQISIKAQDWDPDREDHSAMRVPPEGTIPQGYQPYPYKGNVMAASQNLRNPYSGEFSPELISMGRRNYDIYCAICHGADGGGKGPVAEKMILRPPSLLTAQAKSYSDGRLFHVIVDGQGVMGSYANQIREEEARWAVVNYIRTLQRSE